MKRNKRIVAFFFILPWMFWAAIPSGSHADDPKAREIMNRVNARDDGDHIESVSEMILVGKSGSQRSRLLKTFEQDFEQRSHRITFFLEPADVRDTAFLTYDYIEEGKEDDQWIFLPALKRVRRIAISEKGDSFMGSDFSYADMSRPDLSKFDFELLEERTVNGQSCWMIQCKPRNEGVAEEYGYSKSVILVRKDIDLALRSVFWLKNDGWMKYLDVKRVERIDDIWTPMEIHMTTKKEGRTEHRTILRRRQIQYNKSFDGDLFTTRRMEMGP